MDKQDFLNRLCALLFELPPEEIQRTVDYYSEMIDDAIEEGGVESEVIEKLGSAEDIAKKILSETSIDRKVKENLNEKIQLIKEKAKRKYSVWEKVLLIAGSPLWAAFLIAALGVVLSLYISVWAVIAAFFAVSLALAVSGVACLLASPFLLTPSLMKAILAFGTSLTLMGTSVFLFYFSVFLTKILVKLTVAVITCIIGGEKNEESK